jgi:hypothetical protein
MRGQSEVLSSGALEGYSRRLEGDQNKHPSLGEALANRSDFTEFTVPGTRFTPIPVQEIHAGTYTLKLQEGYGTLDRRP